MTELRTAPAKPNIKFWDTEARKLMLIDYECFLDYAIKRPRNIKMRGSRGLAILGFRHRRINPDGSVNINALRSSSDPVAVAHAAKLVNACVRLYSEITKEDNNASPLHR